MDGAVIDAGEARDLAVPARQAPRQMDRDTGRHQPRLHPELLIGHDGPARDLEAGGNEGHLPSRLHQLLGDRAGHVVLIVVIDHDMTVGQAAGQHIVGGEDPGCRGIDRRASALA